LYNYKHVAPIWFFLNIFKSELIPNANGNSKSFSNTSSEFILNQPQSPYGQSYNNNNYGILTNTNNPQSQLQQQSFYNQNLNNSSTRSKSPPSMQSPPMSPLGRMPISPKSPRQRHSNTMMMMLNNNNNLSANNSNNKITTSLGLVVSYF
jgi:hypothetical protein